MSVIAWDGYSIAADRQAVLDNGLRVHSPKLVRFERDGRQIVVGRLGYYHTSRRLQAWVESGYAIEYPIECDEDRAGRIIVFDAAFNKPMIYHADGNDEGSPVLERFYAWGSGGPVALGALEGMPVREKSARKAVAIAIKHVTGCGMGIVSFSDPIRT